MKIESTSNDQSNDFVRGSFMSFDNVPAMAATRRGDWNSRAMWPFASMIYHGESYCKSSLFWPWLDLLTPKPIR
jgi:hypothetical protein